MTVMSIFNNCRVFREDMPDKDIEDAVVDFTNMVSRILIILTLTLSQIILLFSDRSLGRSHIHTAEGMLCNSTSRGLAVGFPLLWLFIVTSLLVLPGGSWTLLLGYHTLCDMSLDAIKDAYLRIPLAVDYYLFCSFFLFFTLSFSLTCCPCPGHVFFFFPQKAYFYFGLLTGAETS